MESEVKIRSGWVRYALVVPSIGFSAITRFDAESRLLVM